MLGFDKGRINRDLWRTKANKPRKSTGDASSSNSDAAGANFVELSVGEQNKAVAAGALASRSENGCHESSCTEALF
jgi:hypothetical protein